MKRVPEVVADARYFVPFLAMTDELAGLYTQWRTGVADPKLAAALTKVRLPAETVRPLPTQSRRSIRHWAALPGEWGCAVHALGDAAAITEVRAGGTPQTRLVL